MIDRISRERAFMQTAEVWAQRSTCMRRSVGAVIVVNDRIVSVGYNGAPAGQPHCDGLECVPPGETGCTRAVHAEANAINHLPKEFMHSPKKMFVTESPCVACAAKIIDGPVTSFTEVYYINEYRIDTGIKAMLLVKIKVFRMTPSGYISRKLHDRRLGLIEELVV